MGARLSAVVDTARIWLVIEESTDAEVNGVYSIRLDELQERLEVVLSAARAANADPAGARASGVDPDRVRFFEVLTVTRIALPEEGKEGGERDATAATGTAREAEEGAVESPDLVG